LAQEYSFDVSCGFDKQEFTNALDQTRREITNRFDFKGVLADIDLSANELVIHTESEAKLSAIIDILESKMVKRNIPLAVLEKPGRLEEATGGTVRNKIKLIDALNSDQAKMISKQVRDNLPKAKPVIQGDSIRVISKSKDELQVAITKLRELNPKLPLQFTNYRG
jgi:uncharacterized protein YajQ (UPF0234 family)